LYYDPMLGQFTQDDPIGVAGGLNTYGYAAGDPVNFSDPFGLSPYELDGLDVTVSPALCGVDMNECWGRARPMAWQQAAGGGSGAMAGGGGGAYGTDRAVWACRVESFRLGAGTAADLLAVGALVNGGRALVGLMRNYRTNRALRDRGLWVPQQILQGNRGDIVAHGIQVGQAHGVGALAMTPLSAHADNGVFQPRDVGAGFVGALLPLSGLPDQLRRVGAACLW